MKTAWTPRGTVPWRAALCVALTALFLLSYGGEAARQSFDVVILGGRVMDPASRRDRIANVGIRKGRIQSITSRVISGRITLQARGKVVSPGFVDILAGTTPTGDPYKIADGVTTVIATHGGPVDVSRWLAEQRERRPVLNYGTVVGHGSLRRAVGADDRNGPATPEQVARMAMLAEQAMREGALGVGFGIEYVPGASGQEMMALARVAARRDASIHVHIRLPHVFDPFQGINEMIAASAVTGVRAQVVHIGSMAIRRQKEALELIDAARARGIDIAADVYPYTAWMTSIQSAIFDPGWRKKYALDYDDLVWVVTGERLTAETFAKFRAQGGFVACHQIPEEEIILALKHPHVSVASDGVIRPGPANHPRGAGTFSRVLGVYVREQQVLSLMLALRKMTVMPVKRLQAAAPALKRKGRLQVGMDADITVFDPKTVIDRATFQEPARTSTGIVHVLVNGVPVLRNGLPVEGARPGRPIVSREAVRR